MIEHSRHFGKYISSKLDWLKLALQGNALTKTDHFEKDDPQQREGHTLN